MQLQANEPGAAGAIVFTSDVRLSSTRTEKRSVRALPGTFEWRYGRKTADSALYHAGVAFASLWEIAGIAAASSPDLAKAGGGAWKGIADAKLDAMGKIDAARLDIGRRTMSRLVDYCVMGTSAAGMASKYNLSPREMATVLHEDLRACATHFRYL